jgi:hypothetical protein
MQKRHENVAGGMKKRYFLIPVAAAAVYAAWVFGSRHSLDQRWRASRSASQPAGKPEFDSVYGGSAVKILQFYAREGTVIEGSKSVICYGVLNAKSLSIEPRVEGIFPALNRCVPIAPSRDTRYTLTAQGTEGGTVSASFVVGVSPDAATLPKISSFRIESHQVDYRGRTVFLLSFSAQNAATVDIDPPAFPTLHGAPNGRFYVAPEKSTTYTLTVANKRGHKAQQQLTVEIPKS